eukprot:TRINITY_DN44899_c0_g1_i1.p1 TRINITY_DN44899_c0_g1~~TRINITY_DN44899_c0_g1_i1.p1  ORF type:complete len:315 (+),score=89.41 TRINITY_DN44899_c0_g1_i1:36-947(+)
MGKRPHPDQGDGEDELRRACLPVESDSGGEGSEEEQGPPMDAFEYLKRVRAEAKSHSGTVVAANRDALMQAPAAEVLEPARILEEYMVPKRRWRLAVLRKFIGMRSHYAALPAKKGSVALPAQRNPVEWKAFTFGRRTPPSEPLMQAMDQVTLSWLVVCHKNWLCNSPTSASSAPASVTLSKHRHLYKMAFQAAGEEYGGAGSLVWLHALLACIAEPLVPADQTALAELLLTLCQLWKQMDTWGWIQRWESYQTEAAAADRVPIPEGLDVKKLEGEIAAIVTIVHSYFKQGDPSQLWERDRVE